MPADADDRFAPTGPDPLFGQCLIDMTPQDPSPIGEHYPDDTDLAALAAATPYVRRIAGVLDRLAVVDAMTLYDAVGVADDPAARGHLRGLGARSRRVVGLVVLNAAVQGLLDPSETQLGAEGLITAGPDAGLVKNHPLAAWGEGVMPALLNDPVGMLEDRSIDLDEALVAVPGLLLQLLAGARELDCAAVVDALHAEAGRREPRWRSRIARMRIRRHVDTVLALFAEFGLARIEGGPGRARRAVVSPLGLFAKVLFIAEVEGELPAEIDALVREAGYARCRDGYVKLDDLPVQVSMN